MGIYNAEGDVVSKGDRKPEDIVKLQFNGSDNYTIKFDRLINVSNFKGGNVVQFVGYYNDNGDFSSTTTPERFRAYTSPSGNIVKVTKGTDNKPINTIPTS